jgi:myotubularin-related protein 6/7/8
MELIKTPKVENVRMLDRFCKTPSLGTLYLTATHLIFVDPDAKKETWVYLYIIFSHFALTVLLF